MFNLDGFHQISAEVVPVDTPTRSDLDSHLMAAW